MKGKIIYTVIITGKRSLILIKYMDCITGFFPYSFYFEGFLTLRLNSNPKLLKIFLIFK